MRWFGRAILRKPAISAEYAKSPTATRAAYRQGDTLGDEYERWFRARFLQQMRLFFRYQESNDARLIILAWFDDEGALREYDKIRTMSDGLRGERGIAELRRRERLAESQYYYWSKELPEAGERRLDRDTGRAATVEAKDLRRQTKKLKKVVPDQALELRSLNKAWSPRGETGNEISRSEKLQIIPFVEQSHLPARKTLEKLGISCAALCRWRDLYRDNRRQNCFGAVTYQTRNAERVRARRP